MVLSWAASEYNSTGHGMIAMHANQGITFDLDAIRRANPGWKLLRFRGMAGLRPRHPRQITSSPMVTSPPALAAGLAAARRQHDRGHLFAGPTQHAPQERV